MGGAPLATVLVTGAARRIGAAIARELAGRGHAVVIHYRSSSAEAKALLAEITAAGGRAALCEADLDKAAEAETLIDRAAIAIGEPLTGLVNNASLFAFDRAGDATREGMERHFRINMLAPVLLAKHLVGQLPEGRQGAIVNLLDQKLANPNPDFFSYSLTRYAMAGATTMMAQDFAGRCRVNAVAPGITLPSCDQSEEEFRATGTANLLQRLSSPDHVADAVAMLLGNPAIDGQCIWVDGGQRFMDQPRDVMFMGRNAAA